MAQPGGRPPEGAVAGRVRRSSWPTAGGKGLDESDQTPERIAPAARVVGVAHLHAGQRGRPAAVDPADLRRPEGQAVAKTLNQKIDATATALLGLTGVSADPVQSREHILIAQLLLARLDAAGRRPRPAGAHRADPEAAHRQGRRLRRWRRSTRRRTA